MQEAMVAAEATSPVWARYRAAHPGAAPEAFPSPARAAGLVVGLAAGRADALTGRVFDVGDDLEALVAQAETIVRDRLYVVRRQPDRAPPPLA
jgi:hypothetical protein